MVLLCIVTKVKIPRDKETQKRQTDVERKMETET